MNNPRILSSEPLVFAPFRGWCVLFDNPGRSIRQVNWGGQFLDTDANARSNKLYAACWRTLEKNKTREMCPLPIESAHVTFLDGVHTGNLDKIASRQRQESWLGSLPNTTVGAVPEELQWIQSKIMQLRSFRLTLGPYRLDIHEKWASLVCRLKAATAASEVILEELRRFRAMLDQDLEKTLGKPLNDRWNPHTSVAYFVSQEAARAARADLAKWNDVFLKETEGLTLEFTNLALYAFEDMTSFWRVPAAGRITEAVLRMGSDRR